MLRQVQRRVRLRWLDVHAQHRAAALQLLLQEVYRRPQNAWLREEVHQRDPNASATRTARAATKASDLGTAGAVRWRVSAGLEW